jgi:hypothetical protein
VANPYSEPELFRLVETLPRVGVAAVLAACAARLLKTSDDDRPPASPPELIDAVALAKRLGVHESWVRTEYREARLPGKRFGRYIRFDPAAVEAALAARPEASERIQGRTRRRHVL